MGYREFGGATGCLHALWSGMLVNWLVGLAALFAKTRRTVGEKFRLVFLGSNGFRPRRLSAQPGEHDLFLAGGRGGHWTGMERGAPPGASFRPHSETFSAASCFAVLPFWICFGSKDSAMNQKKRNNPMPEMRDPMENEIWS